MTQTPSQGGPTQKGSFGYQEIMDNFYSWQPKSRTDQTLKNTYMGNFIQSGLDMQLAEAAAKNDAALSMQIMNHTANLEEQVAGSLMDKELAVGVQKMGADFDFQNRFAQNEFTRSQLDKATTQTYNLDTIKSQADADTQRIGATGDQDVRQIEASGNEQRQTIGAQSTAEQDLITARTNAETDLIDERRKADVSRIQTTGGEERDTVRTTGDQERQTLATRGDQDRQTIATTGDQTRQNIGKTGQEQRLSMEKGDELEERKENRANARSRTLARSF